MFTNNFYRSVLDLLLALWIFSIFIVLFLWLPSKSFIALKNKSYDARAVTYLAIMTLVTTGGVAFLSISHLFTWLTLVLWYVLFLCLGWQFSKPDRTIDLVSKEASSNLIFTSLDLLDRGLNWQSIQKNIFLKWQRSQQKIITKITSLYLNHSSQILSSIALITILGLSLLLRLEHPLQELRFGHPEAYQNLLVTRKILAKNSPLDNLGIFSSISAVISLLGSIDAMQVVRFLSPLLGFLQVISTGYCVRHLTKNNAAALVSTSSLGVYLFTSNWQGSDRLSLWWQQFMTTILDSLNSSLIRQWTIGDLEIGTIFLVLALGSCDRIFQRKYSQTTFITIICCLILVAIASPQLLRLAFAGAIGLIVGRIHTLSLVSGVWLILALVSAIPENPYRIDRAFLVTLPVGLSLLCGQLFLLLSYLLKIILGKRSQIVVLIVIFAISVNFLLPIEAKINYLEYDLAARKSLEIRSLFPSKLWLIVAPVEQLAQNYGVGWYEDLAEFTKKYADKVNQPDFNFPYSVPDLFIFVEKRPFISFPETQSLPYSVLADPTYTNYRSPSGRASLQFEALKLCEDYLHSHKNASIYYEDRNLKIYHIHLKSA
jgi:hypothetical protein